MSPKERKALMILNDVKVVDLAKKLGITPSTIYLVRADLGRSRRVEMAIAEACGKSRDEMFPKDRIQSAA